MNANSIKKVGKNEPSGSDLSSVKQSVPNSAATGDMDQLKDVMVVAYECYIKVAIAATIDVLERVRSLLPMNEGLETIDDGLDTAAQTLEGLIAEMESKEHPARLPNGGIPVRPIPFPFTPSGKADSSFLDYCRSKWKMRPS